MWTPLLAGNVADRARNAAREIGESLATATVEPAHLGEVALFWAYAAGAWNDAVTDARYDAAVDRLVERIAGAHSVLRLFGGLAGDGWVLGHISDAASEEILAIIDRGVSELLATATWTGPYDLIEGLVGYGVYFVERALAGSAAARVGLARVVDHLDTRHVAQPPGVTWSHEGTFDCGLAHGVPGVVALLAKIVELGDPPPRARVLLDLASRWLWAQQRPAGFPATVDRATTARTAWCYGDPGVGVALWSAAVRTGDSTDAAHEVVRRATVREDTGIVDAALCHGAAGMAHVLDRCYHASGDPVLRDAALRWYERVLALPRPDAPGLLEGTAGIGLALLAATTDSEPSWDRILLCDLP